MLTGALIFLLDSVATAFVAVLLLRFHLQWVRAPFNNPLTQFVMALTDFAVKPARRLIPGLFGLDMATLTVAWLVQCLLIFLIIVLGGRLGGFGIAVLGGLMLVALLELVKIALWMIIILQFLLFIVSFANPYSPYMQMLVAMNRPFARPIQRVLPPIANVDLSPMVVVLLCMLLLQFVLPGLAGLLQARLL